METTLEEAKKIIPKEVFSDLEFLAGIETLPLTQNAKFNIQKYGDEYNPYAGQISRKIVLGDFGDGKGDSYYVADLSHPILRVLFIREIIGKCIYTSPQIRELREEDESTKHGRRDLP